MTDKGRNRQGCAADSEAALLSCWRRIPYDITQSGRVLASRFVPKEPWHLGAGALPFQKSARAGHVEPPEVAALSDIGSWVMSAEEFRKYAEEHQGWARTARSDRECAIFTQMANAWLEVAATNESGAASRAYAHRREGTVPTSSPGGSASTHPQAREGEALAGAAQGDRGDGRGCGDGGRLL